jgi:hypothetical protein
VKLENLEDLFAQTANKLLLLTKLNARKRDRIFALDAVTICKAKASDAHTIRSSLLVHRWVSCIRDIPGLA